MKKKKKTIGCLFPDCDCTKTYSSTLEMNYAIASCRVSSCFHPYSIHTNNNNDNNNNDNNCDNYDDYENDNDNNNNDDDDDEKNDMLRLFDNNNNNIGMNNDNEERLIHRNFSRYISTRNLAQSFPSNLMELENRNAQVKEFEDEPLDSPLLSALACTNWDNTLLVRKILASHANPSNIIKYLEIARQDTKQRIEQYWEKAKAADIRSLSRLVTEHGKIPVTLLIYYYIHFTQYFTPFLTTMQKMMSFVPGVTNIIGQPIGKLAFSRIVEKWEALNEGSKPIAIVVTGPTGHGKRLFIRSFAREYERLPSSKDDNIMEIDCLRPFASQWHEAIKFLARYDKKQGIMIVDNFTSEALKDNFGELIQILKSGVFYDSNRGVDVDVSRVLFVFISDMGMSGNSQVDLSFLQSVYPTSLSEMENVLSFLQEKLFRCMQPIWGGTLGAFLASPKIYVPFTFFNNTEAQVFASQCLLDLCWTRNTFKYDINKQRICVALDLYGHAAEYFALEYWDNIVSHHQPTPSIIQTSIGRELFNGMVKCLSSNESRILTMKTVPIRICITYGISKLQMEIIGLAGSKINDQNYGLWLPSARNDDTWEEIENFSVFKKSTAVSREPKDSLTREDDF